MEKRFNGPFLPWVSRRQVMKWTDKNIYGDMSYTLCKKLHQLLVSGAFETASADVLRLCAAYWAMTRKERGRQKLLRRTILMGIRVALLECENIRLTKEITRRKKWKS